MWKLDGGIELLKIDGNGKQILLQRDMLATQPISMRNQDEILKDLSSFTKHCKSLAWKVSSRSYTRSHGDLIAYWKGVQDALEVPPLPRTSLLNGFWPATRVQSSMNDILTVDGIVREEFAFHWTSG